MLNVNAHHLCLDNDVIQDTTVSNVQYWPYNFIIVSVVNCDCVLTERNSPGIY